MKYYDSFNGVGSRINATRRTIFWQTVLARARHAAPEGRGRITIIASAVSRRILQTISVFPGKLVPTVRLPRLDAFLDKPTAGRTNPDIAARGQSRLAAQFACICIFAISFRRTWLISSIPD